jgi:outer membrane protein assembly factor BamD (BamD/ComL family)
MGIAYEHANRAMTKGDPVAAAEGYSKVLDAYPNADDVRIDLFEAYTKSGDVPNAVKQFNYFHDRTISKDQLARLDGIAGELGGKIQTTVDSQ